MSEAGGVGAWKIATAVFVILTIISLGLYILHPRTVTKTQVVTSPVTTTYTTTKTFTTTYTTISPTTVTKEKTVTSVETVTQTKTASLADLARMIREGQIDVGTEYSLEFGKRYHNIHAIVLGLSCNTCHQAKTYPADYLYIRKYVAEKMAEEGEIPGVVDRGVCLGCHRSNGVAHELYKAYYGPGLTSGAGG
ncbi:MAG: hypothetical protein F7C81_00190 [Desulfurococcales archaeon]|nr:hypothetical protein [Desulfurococcales archaeon]